MPIFPLGDLPPPDCTLKPHQVLHLIFPTHPIAQELDKIGYIYMIKMFDFMIYIFASLRNIET